MFPTFSSVLSLSLAFFYLGTPLIARAEAPAAATPQATPAQPAAQPAARAPAAQAQAQAQAQAAPAAGAPDTTRGPVDFEDPDAFIDISDALKSKQYVHRAILSTVIHNTSRFNVSSFYVNHLLGFSSVYSKSGYYGKYTTGLQGLSAGYVTSGGHALEVGMELSAVGNIYAGYKYFYRPSGFSLWPFVGAGVGSAVKALNFSDGPVGSNLYNGPSSMEYATVGLLIPLVDVGLKAEARFNFYGGSRIVLTQGIGAILFL